MMLSTAKVVVYVLTLPHVLIDTPDPIGSYVYVTLDIHPNPVGRTGFPPGKHPSVAVQDADPRGCPLILKLADIEDPLGIHSDVCRTVDIVPHGYELPFAGKYLDAAVLWAYPPLR